ncbi:amino acid adenylation domain-containing protein, partial [Longimicrobium sp.]|uniref:amino acid adenylation domain-containing protein n=1 Tax=Longimicrobium sp. TaxID=2029185 RepID=UPI003B3A2DE5
MSTTSKLDQLSPEQRRLLALRLKQRKAEEPRAPAIEQGAGGEYPLAFTQQRLWMLDRLQPGGAAYNMPGAARFKQPLDSAVVERVIGEIVRRHGALRTRFEARDEGPVQVVAPFAGFHLPLHDLADQPEAQREAGLARIAAEEATAPFALDQGAFRARLVRMGEADFVVLATMHHIVSDGWSISVFWREFEELLAAFGAGLASPLPPLPVQYGEHARRERERLAGAALDGLLAWWRNELRGAPTLLELPTDRPRPAVASQRGAAYVTELDASLAERVSALALREGTTPFNVLLAAFQLLMGRYADTEDLLVGTAVAGRRTRDVEPLIGFFANTLVLRGDLSGEPTFRQLVARVHRATMGAFEHQDLPFERLVEEMAPERTLAYSPLVQALFVQHAAYPGHEQDPGAEDDGAVEGVQQEVNAAKFDLTFGVAQDAGRTWAGVEYAADLFDRATIERMVRHYATLLDSALASPGAAVATLELMPAEERDAVCAMGAAVAHHHPVSTTLHDAFAAQAARTPGAPALTYGDRTITYAELDAHAERLARRLRARGVGADVLVGLCVERSMETVVGILGILKAGAAYLPLDPAYPDDRLAYMLEDSGARLVVTAGSAADRLPPSVDLVRMDDEAPRGESEDFYTNRTPARPPSDARLATAEDAADRLPSSADLVRVDDEDSRGRSEDSQTNLTPARTGPDALAYVIYTSGSTGRPKGVQVTHANVIRLMKATDPWFGFGADDAWTLFHSYAFDFSVWEIWGALLYGGRLVVVPFEVSRDPARFHALLRDERVTVLNQTPSAFRQLIRADADAAARGDAADLALRYVIFGGEALDPASLRTWVDRRGADRPRLVNMYGITETTVHVTYRVISQDDVRAGSASPIGIPISDLSVHLLDRRGRIVPIGLAGEMYVGGGGVARGYLNRPELTARRFVPDPFSDKVADRLYRSGDLARRLADGSLEFLGRADDQVKVRGFRIELGEIESVLLEHPSVREAVVLTRGAGDERRLVAWTVAADSVTAAELRAHLLAHLPEYMVPSAFVPMDRLPLTRNGKVDRRALPEPDAVDVAGAEYVPPRTQTEQVVAALWAELLGVERVGATDRFFDLGGQSLLATRAVARVREALRVEVPVRAVFEHPALEAFAAEIDRLLRAEAGVEAPPLRRAERTEDPPLSFAQERLWFIDRLEPGNPVYNMAFPLRMRGPLDVAALERALGEVVRRHESLRTRFVPVDGRPVQRIEPADGWHLPVDAVSDALTDDAREAEVAARVGAWVAARFDLERGPLFRARLLGAAHDDHVLLIGMHHSVSDGWSMGVFWRELMALYRAFHAGLPSPLPELPIQYADFAVWQRGWLHGDALRRQVAWWREHLAGAPALLELPTDRPRPPVQSHRGGAVAFTVPVEVAEPVRALARRSGATLFMALMAAWQVLLARWSGQDDVVVGTPVAGRTRGETEGLIGFFVNTLAIRGGLGDDPAFSALLARVREATLGAYAHQDLPFERLVQEIQPSRSLGHAPVFQAMLVLQNVPDEGDGTFADDLRLEGVGGGEGAGVAKVDLTLGVMELQDGSLAAGLEYAADLWDRATMERMSGHFVHLLASAPAALEAPVSTLELMPAEERDAVRAMGAAVAHYPVSTTLHDAFAAQAARTPDAPALTYGDRTITYAELDAHAERLARRLRTRGVGADVLVGLCVERSPETVVGILGILKAGAAYLPLDPAYPDDRLAYMLEDSGARLAVTSGDAADRLPADIELVRVDDEASQGESEDSQTNLTRTRTSPDALAYVIYTSGSTGRPKGVQVTHANVIRLMTATDPWFGFGADDVWTLFHSYAFDFSVWEIWGALLYGGRLAVVPFEVSRDPARFHALLRDERVTVLNQTPSAFRQLIRADDDAAASGDSADLALRYVIFGGEALDPASLRTWVDRRGADRPRLVNMYGITETTVHVTYRVISEDDVRAGSASPIGIPIPDLSVHLLDRRGRIVPIGLAGEMYVGGGGVARGYLNRPELTSQRFVPDPFSDKVADRLYRSGDLARRLADGSLEFLGRADDQVKVRGFRIELGEIESVLLEHPSVREAVVLMRGAGDARRLVAWTVAADSVTAAELRAHLLAHLPEYMVPSAFVPMDRLPLTRNGKVDRSALPEPDAADVAGAEYLAPRTQTEQVLAAVWAELLGVERVGVADGFFDLGGHSLLATRVVSRVRGHLGVEVPVRALFERPELGAFAAEIDRLLRAEAGVEAPPIRPADRSGALPLTFAQERLWFVDRLEPGSPVYHMPFHYLLRGVLDVDALRRAFSELVRRHETLRTALPFTGDQPVQRILPAAPVDLPLHDFAGIADEAQRDAATEAVMRDVAERAFDLERGPLFRAAVARMAEDEHVLMVNLHHVISDGWSVGVLWNELSALYGAFHRGEASPLPEPALQYGDFAVWQREWLAGDVLEAQLGYWRRKLAGAPPLLELPTDRPRPAVQTYAGAAESVVLTGGDAAAVLALGRREGSTLFMVLLAAMDVVVARLAGQDDVVIGTPIAGRTRAETEGMIGLFLNSLALRTDLSGAPTFRELLRRVRETTLEAYAHQDLPFERILEELAPERSLSHSPIFQVMLNLSNFAEGDVSLPGLEVQGIGGAGEVASKFDLTLYAGESPDGIVLHLVYNTALFDAPRVREMLAQMADVLRQAADDADRPIHAYSLLTGDAAALLPDPAAALSAEWRGSVPQLFARHAARTPDAVAVEDPACPKIPPPQVAPPTPQTPTVFFYAAR